MKRFAAKIKEWIIHRLGGITETEIPVKTKVQFRYVNVTPQRISAMYSYTVFSNDRENVAETYAKRETMEKIITELDKAGFIRYTTSNIWNDLYDNERNNVHKAIRADLWVVKAP